MIAKYSSQCAHRVIRVIVGETGFKISKDARKIHKLEFMVQADEQKTPSL